MLYRMRELRIPVAEARKNLASVLAKAAKNERVKITRYNQTLAGIISRADLMRLSHCDELLSAPRVKRSKKRNRKRGKDSASG
jgi:PHD/YefM family antitoxin component YafN of YafNO toxin-antitoxin module